MATGVVVRFDSRRGYGFLAPDDGGEDVFVHQNNIGMEGFRFLQVGERVTYELEVGEKGMKAVSVSLLEPRLPRTPPRGEPQDDRDPPRREHRDRDRHDRPERAERHDHGRFAGDSESDAAQQLDRMRRKQERLISLLVSKGVLAPGEIDGVDAIAADGQA
ncbi:MAG TPA: cold shock domain-containing protein [Planctomycetota bacterium]|nr:cold shock domain-containing protein [Planctomycetota bacterium]